MDSAARVGEWANSAGGRRLALARFFAHACLPEAVTLEAGLLGRVTVRPRLLTLDHTVLAKADAYETVSLTGPSGHASLFVERRLALAMVNAVLGHPVPLANGPLSRIERGIFEGVLMGLCGGLGFAAGVQLGEDRNPPSTNVPLAIGASVSIHGLTGWAYLCGSDAFLAQAWALPSSAQARVLADLRLEVARTRVPPSEVKAADCGDAVVFDEVRPLSPTDPWEVLLYLGEAVVPAIAVADGSISVVDAHAAGPSTFDGSGTAAVAAPVSGAQITAELGPLQSSSGSPVSLLCGLSLGTRRTDRIYLRLNGLPWAEGGMVTVDGQLAVGITKKLAD